MKYKSIAISGPVASGTTTAACDVSKKLGIDYKSAGDYFRQYMIDHGIDLYKKEDLPDEIDRNFDKEIENILQSEKSIVFDGLYVGYFARNMEDVLKILLIADENVRIERALKRTHTHKETAETVRKRDKSHDLKFRKLYADENFLNPKFFDLVINTTNLSQKQVEEKILQKFNQ